MSTKKANSIIKQQNCRTLSIDDYFVEPYYESHEKITKGKEVFYPQLVTFVRNGQANKFVSPAVVKEVTIGSWPFEYKVWRYDYNAMSRYAKEVIGGK